jgi:LAO/AO transport system kinase
MANNGELASRRLRRAAQEIEAIALTSLRERFGGLRGDRHLDALAQKVANGELDSYAAADDLIASVTT